MDKISQVVADEIDKLTQGIIRAFMQQPLSELAPPEQTPAQPAKPRRPRRRVRMTQEKGRMIFFFEAPNGRTYRASRRRDLDRQAEKIGVKLYG